MQHESRVLRVACSLYTIMLRAYPAAFRRGYTDGINQAINAVDEEWGEERFMDAVRPNRAVSARTLIDRLTTAAHRSAAGAPQHDDMTLLVVRAI